MLVMTHREGEVLEIGPDVRVYIKRVKGNWVRLAIDAPKDVVLKRVRVDREEPVPSEES
jgi:carbon storage regulator